MYREFEELGVTISGVSYGFFTGEAQFDEVGEPVVIDIEASAFDRKSLHLDIEDLVRERVALRRKHGSSFLEDGSPQIREHSKRWMLFQALSESLVERYREDIEDYRSELRAISSAKIA
jgi:hypothetical protein